MLILLTHSLFCLTNGDFKLRFNIRENNLYHPKNKFDLLGVVFSQINV